MARFPFQKSLELSSTSPRPPTSRPALASAPANGALTPARMVELCRDRGLAAEAGDLFTALAGAEEGSLGVVVSFHVIEHLPPAALDRLVRLAWRALRPGGVLILETPNPLSLVVAARNFWLDPTHVRPVHPEILKLMYELAGFAPVERLDLRPFPAAARLPEIDLAKLPADQRPLADQVIRLRDRLDDLLFGCQDFGMVGKKPGKKPASPVRDDKKGLSQAERVRPLSLAGGPIARA
ncbi:MAG TPA: class I SAM-dependent methyltransferase [Thermoanaerobaculia bacterium]|jgi:O-antigen chain-terminating methyltransferase|nr:class I SAM-dependent methyltransferase [Thermoanaerobaculia bacterium]